MMDEPHYKCKALKILQYLSFAPYCEGCPFFPPENNLNACRLCHDLIPEYDISSRHFLPVSLHCCLVLAWFLDFFTYLSSPATLLSVGEGQKHLSKACYVLETLRSSSLLSLVTTEGCQYSSSHFTEKKTEKPQRWGYASCLRLPR